MLWFAVWILKCVENQIWTVKTDCMKASSFETLLHLPKTISAKDVQPPYHTWLPWCNSQRCHAFHMKWQLFLKAVQYWSQKKYSYSSPAKRDNCALSFSGFNTREITNLLSLSHVFSFVKSSVVSLPSSPVTNKIDESVTWETRVGYSLAFVKYWQ